MGGGGRNSTFYFLVLVRGYNSFLTLAEMEPVCIDFVFWQGNQSYNRISRLV